jgi:hypothetical protein
VIGSHLAHPPTGAEVIGSDPPHGLPQPFRHADPMGRGDVLHLLEEFGFQ